VRRRARNVSVKSAVRTQVKKASRAIEARAADARQAVAAAASSLDRAARKRIIHPNKAARLKSRLAKRLNAAAS